MRTGTVRGERSPQLVFLVLACMACTDLPDPAPRGPEFRRGISLGLFASTTDPEEQRAIYRQLLDEVRAIGATDVELVVEGTQRDVRATEIVPPPGEALLAFTIDEAHARNLRVFLMPILRLERRTEREWRGTLVPIDRDAWWASYRAFILGQAAIAARAKVDLFSVGSELVSMEADRDRWRELIGAVREVYSGKLTYSANWDHFEPVEFFDVLDVAGVTAYQPLAAKPGEASDEELDRGWDLFRARLRSWASASNLSYVFTEVGYPSNASAAVRPWEYKPSGEADLELQLRCYRSLFRTWNADSRLAGVFVWNWFGFGGPNDHGYTPRKKPAEKVLRHWYRTDTRGGCGCDLIERSREGFER